MPYKRVDLAVTTATQYGLPLTVVGDGVERQRLQSMAGPTVNFVGAISDRNVLRAHYARARALLFCGVEGFGIVPVEAMAAGCPVVAFADGGVIESVCASGKHVAGVYFTTPSAASLKDAIDRLEIEVKNQKLQASSISAQTSKFCRTRFCDEMVDLLLCHRDIGHRYCDLQ